LATNEGDSNDYKSFRPSLFFFLNYFKSNLMLIDNICSSPPSPPTPLNPMETNIQLCPTPMQLSYGQYRQPPPSVVNALGGWIVNPSMQSIPQMFHPMFNPHQQYGREFFSFVDYSHLFRKYRREPHCL